MGGARLQLFRLLGIPISLDLSWLVILALLTLTLTNQFHAETPGLSTTAYVVMGFLTALAFFACVVLHEMGHALVARATGLPIRGITLFLFGGVAELGAEPASAGGEFVMAIAGPVVSAVLAALFWWLAHLGFAADWSAATQTVLRYLAGINAAVLAFNLIPAFPLDGGRVLRAILWGSTGNLRRATYWAALAGRGFGWFLIGVGLLSVFQEMYIQGIWLGLIGLFVNNAAQGSYREVVVRQVLKGEPVHRFMNAHPVVVPPDVDLRRWVDEYVYRYHRKMFPVAADGRLEGVITTKVLSQYPREEWERHTIGEVMRPDFAEVSVAADTDAFDALGKMQRTGSSRLLVTQGDRLVGILTLKDLLRFLHLKLELEDQGA